MTFELPSSDGLILRQTAHSGDVSKSPRLVCPFDVRPRHCLCFSGECGCSWYHAKRLPPHPRFLVLFCPGALSLSCALSLSPSFSDSLALALFFALCCSRSLALCFACALSRSLYLSLSRSLSLSISPSRNLSLFFSLSLSLATSLRARQVSRELMVRLIVKCLGSRKSARVRSIRFRAKRELLETF